MSTLIANIGQLVTLDPAEPDRPIRTGAALVIDDGRVAWVGDAAAAPAVDTRIDAEGAAVIPGFVDSHSHLVFAGDRVDEFEARMAGRPYTAGGIRTTVAATTRCAHGCGTSSPRPALRERRRSRSRAATG